MLARSRAVALAASALLGVATVLAGCSGGSPDSSEPASTVKELPVEIAHGKVTPNAKSVEVPVGTKIRLTVTSDAEDEIHVHGYDKELAVRPGKKAELEFPADETGRFEIETHETDALAYQLVVTP